MASTSSSTISSALTKAAQHKAAATHRTFMVYCSTSTKLKRNEGKNIWDGTGKVLHKRTCVPRMVHEKKWFSSFYFSSLPYIKPSIYRKIFSFYTHAVICWTQEHSIYGIKKWSCGEKRGKNTEKWSQKVIQKAATGHIAGSTTRWGSS